MTTMAGVLPNAWRKSTYSLGEGECIEVNDAVPGAVRDSKDPEGPALRFSPDAWRSFTRWAAMFEV
ncbi:DUF397 domain-containing protein [Kitasatospora sp. NPDC050543]|uniref:DUF397 domain-containing protein n=1 Tax=Kitasatospora sp. NPDC050543 TaxID=3364054 RepID=UPI00379A6AC6